MARMMAKSRWTQKPYWYCCRGHDPNIYNKGTQRQREARQWQQESREENASGVESLGGTTVGAIVNFVTQRWRAQPDDMIGGWCVTPEADKRSPAEGAPSLADFTGEEIAQHVAAIHNQWLQDRGEIK